MFEALCVHMVACTYMSAHSCEWEEVCVTVYTNALKE